MTNIKSLTQAYLEKIWRKISDVFHNFVFWLPRYSSTNKSEKWGFSFSLLPILDNRN